MPFLETDNFTVSSSPLAVYNSDFLRTGVYNGESIYANTAGYQCWYNGFRWVFSQNVGDSPVFIGEDKDTPLDVKLWNFNGYFSSFTLTLISPSTLTSLPAVIAVGSLGDGLTVTSSAYGVQPVFGNTSGVYFDSNGIANYATTANQASYADSANQASYADSANTANTANTATNGQALTSLFDGSGGSVYFAYHASNANNADNASNADQANFASNANNANNANYADQANNANSANSANNAYQANNDFTSFFNGNSYAPNANNADQANYAYNANYANNAFNTFFHNNGYNTGVSIDSDVITAAGFVSNGNTFASLFDGSDGYVYFASNANNADGAARAETDFNAFFHNSVSGGSNLGVSIDPTTNVITAAGFVSNGYTFASLFDGSGGSVYVATYATYTSNSFTSFFGYGDVNIDNAGVSAPYFYGNGSGLTNLNALQPSTANTRAAVMDTVYQPSASRDTLVLASVQIATNAGGDGKIELLSDASNPPTTVRGTFRVGTALTTMAQQLCCIVKAGDYYKLKSTTAGGTPTYTVVGLVQENVQ